MGGLIKIGMDYSSYVKCESFRKGASSVLSKITLRINDGVKQIL